MLSELINLTLNTQFLLRVILHGCLCNDENVYIGKGLGDLQKAMVEAVCKDHRHYNYTYFE